ncbi:MAG: NAD(P)/FAD-dependent oxidoreductase, partial [Candidatus Thermoplasmatota archaeon]|nr:NAD(P)/FAD-dependent oxidoreductase [Candidatus Thermoplasmatota archaeon]
YYIGGGSGGLSAANHLAYKLREPIKNGDVEIILVEGSQRHYYQPGFLEIPFGLMTPHSTYKPLSEMLADGIKHVPEFATALDLKNRLVRTNGQSINYDFLIIATGARYDYDSIPGLKEATNNFYSLDSAVELKKKLNSFVSGRIVVGVPSMPYKCTPAPLEAVFMLHDYFTKRKIRDKVEIQYVYPMPMAFPDKGISDIALKMFSEKGIGSSLGFQIKAVDAAKRELVSVKDERIAYDLALIVPPHRGSRLLESTGETDQMGWIKVDGYTLNFKGYENAYAIGDATNLQVSKAGSVADAEAIVVSDRIAQSVLGEEPVATYDGSGGALMLTGIGRASMITSSYTQKPIFMPESYSFYWLKMIYNNVYWNMTAKPVLNGVVR